MCPQLAYPHGCCDRVFIEPGPIESKKSVPFIILSLISLSLTEIYSKFAKQLIQIAGPKNIQHNANPFGAAMVDLQGTICVIQLLLCCQLLLLPIKYLKLKLKLA